MKKKWIVFLLLIVFVAITVILYVYKPHRNIANEDANIKINATELFNEFSRNEKVANTKYLDKVIEISGQVTTVDNKNNTLTLDNHVNVNFLTNPQIELGQKIKIKGRCVGYNELMEEIILDQATILKP